MIIKLAKFIVIEKAKVKDKQVMDALEEEASDKIVHVPRSSTSIQPKRVVDV